MLLSGVLNTLAPVFLIVLLGAVLRRTGFLTEAFSVLLNKLVFWFALPCLLFLTIAEGPFRTDGLETSAVLMAASLLTTALAWLAAPWLGISRFSRGAFTQCAFRSNSAYVGLPVIVIAYAGRAGAEEAASIAVLTLAPCVILYNVLAVLVLTPADPQTGTRRVDWRKVALGVATNPLILACIAGGLFLAAGLRPPSGIARTLRSLGALAGPGALIALGSALTFERMQASFRAAHLATLFKLAVCPAVGWVLLRLANLDADARFIALVYLACPTAVASYVMTEAMNGDAPLAAGAVAVSTVYSVVALGAVLALAGPA